MKLRIKFSKQGPIIFIGHLDMMRYFQKAMRRAEVDISYSGGFSPHQIMSFAAPLGVGISSNGEYMDIAVNSLTSSKQVKDALNAVMAEGVKVEDVKLLPDDAVNAMSSVAAAKYSIALREGFEKDIDFFGQIADYMDQKSIPVIKTTKKGQKEIDLKPHIYEFYYNENENKIMMLVDASSSGNIKPGFVLENYYAFCGCHTEEFEFKITREETYTNIGTPEKPELVPLSDIGEDY